MKWTTPFIIASAIGLSNAFSFLPVVRSTGPPEEIENRPRLSAIIEHLEKNNKLTWEDHELGGGAKVAVYESKDWQDAKVHLSKVNDPAYPHATLAPRLPAPQGGQGSVMPGTTIVPIQEDETTATTAVSSGTSSAPMADNTNAVTKWVCKQPYNIPVSLGESALASIICSYITPFLVSLVTGSTDTIVERTMQVPAQEAADQSTAARVFLHIEKKQLWPGLKSVFCSALITQIANNAYCWGYGDEAHIPPPSRIKRQAVPGTVGGTLWIYDSMGIEAIGLIEMETTAA